MRIAFIVATYNRSDALLAVLHALAPQCAPGDMIIVADDGSRPEHVQALRGGFHPGACPCPVWHVWQPDIGFTLARSRNLAGAVARREGADYLIFLDGDCIPSPHFAAGHRALAEPGHFVMGSRVLLGEEFSRQVTAGEVDPGRLAFLDWLRRLRRGDVNKLTHLVRWVRAPGRIHREFRWRGIRGCNFAMWRQDYEAVNGFDEVFSGWGHEDADMALRLHHLGRVRRNGHLATEVLHLWHRENPRANEGINRQRVQERMAQGIVRAEVGLAQVQLGGEVTVTALGGPAARQTKDTSTHD